MPSPAWRATFGSCRLASREERRIREGGIQAVPASPEGTEHQESIEVLHVAETSPRSPRIRLRIKALKSVASAITPGGQRVLTKPACCTRGKSSEGRTPGVLAG
jgi:hypothetical protein